MFFLGSKGFFCFWQASHAGQICAIPFMIVDIFTLTRAAAELQADPVTVLQKTVLGKLMFV